MTLRLRGSSSQYVDITASPNAGDATLTLPTDSGTVTVRDASGGTNVGTGVTIGNPSANTLTVSNSGGERFRITAAGSVGINTAVGASVGLNLHQISGAAAQVRFQGSVTGTGEGDGFGLGNSGTVDAYVWNYEAGHIQFATSNSPRLTITSVGRMLLGTTAEGHESADDFTVSDSGDVGITIRSTDSNQTQISFSDATSGTGEYAGQISYFHTDNYMRFRTNSEERLRINSAGLVGIGTDNPTHPLEVHSGGATNIVAKSTNGNGGFLNYSGLSNTGTTTFSVNHNGMIYTASGLNFGTATSPVTSQTLDDYEEGSFDPSFTSTGGTLTSNNTALNYVKVGRMVTIAGRILINTATTPTGTVTITLPFAYTTTPNTGVGSPYMTHGLAYLHGPSFPANYQRAFWELSSPTNKAALYFERDGQGWSTFDGQNFSSNQYVTVNITYFTDL